MRLKNSESKIDLILKTELQIKFLNRTSNRTSETKTYEFEKFLIEIL